MTIPARIIQTGKERDLPLKQRAFSTNLRLLNPGYEWCFFSDDEVERFVDAEFPQYRPTFDAFAFPIQRYDFFRYLAVYRLGGFYFDLDVLLARPLESLRAHECVFPFEGLTFSRLIRAHGIDWEIGNFAFGATPHHPFLKAVIENCVTAQNDRGWVRAMMRGVPPLSRPDYQVLVTTGPGLLSRTFAENPQLASSVTVLFPDDVSDTSAWNRFGDFGVHLMEGSWRPRMSRLRRRLAQRVEAWTLKRLIQHRRTSVHPDLAGVKTS